MYVLYIYSIKNKMIINHWGSLGSFHLHQTSNAQETTQET
jgi:hypothetical protein